MAVLGWIWTMAAASAVGTTVDVDLQRLTRRYDGHGGLSAGASSRLLYDYHDPFRSDILDYLFKPSFGASLPICKVEIGGDVQSTDGTESSHMHTPRDLNFDRGYEFWLMKEAKARNPQVKTYVLSWGVPGWVGNGSFFSSENVDYQTKFLEGARDVHNITVDYIGVWNERAWGTVDYIEELRESLDRAGFAETQIVGADGSIPTDQIHALETNKNFSAAEPVLGAHYPCARDEPESFWALEPPKTYWSDEDFSTIGGDWAGGSCWGRSLNQNYVKLNATSTISWATLWSVYDSWRYFGNGLMYALQPWSGNYTVPPAIWTSAHTTQFASPGWWYLDTGGLLPGGGSWTALVPPPRPVEHMEALLPNGPAPRKHRTAADDAARRTVYDAIAGADVSIVLEKLEGACLRCRTGPTKPESVTLKLHGMLSAARGAAARSLVMWLTNSTVSFLRIGEVPIATDGTVTVWLDRDSIVTLTTLAGQRKGTASTCSGDAICTGVYAPFPMPYETDYENATVGSMARFHADNGGVFEVREEIIASAGGNPPRPGTRNKVLLQAAPMYSTTGTAWVTNADPITSLGASDWANYRVSVDVKPMAPPPAYAVGDPRVPLPTKAGMLTDAVVDPVSNGVYGGVCVRQIDQAGTGFCLLVGAGLQRSDHADGALGIGWVLQAGESTGVGRRSTGTILASGELPQHFDLSTFHRASLQVQGQSLVAAIDGAVVYSGVSTAVVPPVGLAALRSGYHYAEFDNLRIDLGAATATSFPNALFDKFLLWPPTPPPGGSTNPATARNDFEGLVGVAVTIGQMTLHAVGLGRFAAGHGATQSHNLTIYDATSTNNGEPSTPTAVAWGTVDLAQSQGGDVNGFAWTENLHGRQLRGEAAVLLPGHRYYIVSSEALGGDFFFDRNVQVQPRPALLHGLPVPVYRDSSGWHESPGSTGWGESYGPVNVFLKPAQ